MDEPLERLHRRLTQPRQPTDSCSFPNATSLSVRCLSKFIFLKIEMADSRARQQGTHQCGDSRHTGGCTASWGAGKAEVAPSVKATWECRLHSPVSAHSPATRVHESLVTFYQHLPNKGSADFLSCWSCSLPGLCSASLLCQQVQRMEGKKEVLTRGQFTASYFYPKREKKEQNPLASSNTRQPELQL